MSEPTIAAGFPKALLVFAVSRGADRQSLLDRAAIQSRDLAEPDSRVKLSRYIALFEAAIAACSDPALALHFGEAVRMQDITIVGLVCEAAETAADVGRQLNRYSRLVIDEGPDVDMVRGVPGKDGVWLETASPIYNANPPMIEAELTRLVCNTRATFRDVPEFRAMRFPLAAHFTYPEPAWRDEYTRVFQAPLVFNSDRNGLLLDWTFPTLKQPPGNRFVFGALSERADALLKELARATTVRAKVESLLMPILHTGDASMDEIAIRMGLSRRTLLRKLSAEGVTFEKVLDGLRHRLALHYLSGKKVSVNETAYLVGFSDPSAFSRAFRRWTGSTPGKLLEAENGR
ncbi:MAG TPA: AraC family transcriptional regulator ligand-binding domain-containing protein [Rhizomicrobium sp.]